MPRKRISPRLARSTTWGWGTEEVGFPAGKKSHYQQFLASQGAVSAEHHAAFRHALLIPGSVLFSRIAGRVLSQEKSASWPALARTVAASSFTKTLPRSNRADMTSSIPRNEPHGKRTAGLLRGGARIELLSCHEGHTGGPVRLSQRRSGPLFFQERLETADASIGGHTERRPPPAERQTNLSSSLNPAICCW
jgi:hypothetical protein